MRICLIQAWGFKGFDGSNLRVYFLLKELLSRGHEVVVIHSSLEDALYTHRQFKCKTYSAGVGISRWDSYKNKIVKYIKFAIKAFLISRRIKCDAIFGISLINAFPTVFHPSAKKIIMYVDFMSHFYRYAHPQGVINLFLFKLSNFLEHFTIHRADKIIVITEELKKLLPRSCWYKIKIIPDGVDTLHFKPLKDTKTKIRQKLGIGKEEIVIGYQGAIEPHDGLQFLVSVAPRLIETLPNIRFLIAGQGSFLKEIKQMARRNNSSHRFIFTGWLPHSEIPIIMSATDFNLIPIPNHPATRGIITFRLMESIASGVSVIANNLPGIREIADESMVFFTDVENPEKFFNDIIKAIKTSKTQREKMIARAREKAKTLDWRLIAKRDADSIEEVSK